MDINWEGLAAISAVLAVAGTGAIMVLKSIFVTKSQCEKHHEDTDTKVCGKMDGVKTDIKKLSDTVDDMEKKREAATEDRHKKEVWLAESLTRIADATGASIDSMPK